MATELNKHRNLIVDDKNVIDGFDLVNDCFQRLTDKFAPKESEKEEFQNPKMVLKCAEKPAYKAK